MTAAFLAQATSVAGQEEGILLQNATLDYEEGIRDGACMYSRVRATFYARDDAGMYLLFVKIVSVTLAHRALYCQQYAGS